MIIYGRDNTPLLDVIVTSSAQHEEEMMKSDFVRLSWSDNERHELPVGAYIPFDNEHFELLEPYTPEQKSECEFKYEPQFQHPKMYLGKVIFERPSQDTEGNDITYMDWPYTGSVSNLLNEIVKVINDTFGFSDEEKFSFMLCDFQDKVISMQFNSTDILSAISSTANQCECEAHLDWKRRILFFGKVYINGSDTPTLTIGGNVQVPSTNKNKEGYFNAFHPQGSTRNIMRKSQSEEFVQSDVRLNLRGMAGDPYPDGIIYTDGKGNILTKDEFEQRGEKAFVKPLIFEEIYPKTDMYVYDVRYRERYRLDADETKKDRRIVTYTDDDGTKHYLRYANWFVKLSIPTLNASGEATAWNPYVIKGTIRLPYNRNTLEFNDSTRTIKAFITIALLEEMFTDLKSDVIPSWTYMYDDRDELLETVCDVYTSQHENTKILSSSITLDHDPENYHWWDVSEDYGSDIHEVQIGATANLSVGMIRYENGAPVVYATKNISKQVNVSAVYKAVHSKTYNIGYAKDSFSGTAEVNALDRYLTISHVASSDYAGLKQAFQAGEYVSVTSGMNGKYLPNDCTPSEIIDGTEPIIAFQTNTYKKKIGTDAYGNDIYQFPLPSQLTGLGSGDGNGHYGFKVRSMKIEGESYVTQANIRSQDEEDGDTGILDMDGNPAQVDINDFEIEFEENDKTIIPSTKEQGIIPRGETTPSLFCNKVNLYNIIVGSASEEAAKGELRDKTLEYIAESLKDKDADTLKSCPVMFEENNPNLFIGQRVVVDDGLNPSESRESHQKIVRVQKLITKIDLAFEQEITVGNAILKGNTTQTKEKVDAIVNGNIVVGGTSEAYVKSVVENYGAQNFLSKVKEDYAERLIGFAKGLWVKAKDMFGIDEEGNAKLKSVTTENIQAAKIIASLLKSPNFKEAVGMIGQGFGLKLDGDIATLQTDNLIVLGQMIVNSLNIREVTYIGGVYILTPAGSTVFEVQPLYSDGNASDTRTWTDVGSGAIVGYRVLWLADNGTTSTMNFWKQGDQAYCKTFNLSEAGQYENFRSHNFWRLVCRTGQTKLGDDTYHYADLANVKNIYLYDNDGQPIMNEGGTVAFLGFKADHTADMESVPEVGDKVVCFGSQRDKTRQAAIQLTAEGVGSIAIYDKINNFQRTDKNEIHFFSKDRVKMNSRRFYWSTEDGDSVPPVVYRGAWVGTTTTPYPETNPKSSWGDEWTYNDANWIYIADKPTYEPPGTTPSKWTKSKGEKGDDGENSLHVEIYGKDTLVNGEGEIFLIAHAFDGETDITDNLLSTAFSWERSSEDANADANWNALHRAYGNALVVDKDDVTKRAMFICIVDYELTK